MGLIHTGDSTVAKVLLGIGAPVVGFGFWGAVDFHRARHAESLRLAKELTVSGLAAAAWYAAGQHTLGIALEDHKYPAQLSGLAPQDLRRPDRAPAHRTRQAS